jgi:predicted enzyme related to lactoylglutathione lyase
MAAKRGSKKAKKAGKAKAAPKRATPKRAAAKRAPAKRPAARAAAPAKAKPRHPVVHWEIQSQDPGRLHSFYSSVFGWKIDSNNPMNYGMVASDGSGGIAGGIGGTQMPESRVLVYAAVPSIDDVLSRVSMHGGKTVMPRQDIGPVIMALYEDPEGNLMGLLES